MGRTGEHSRKHEPVDERQAGMDNKMRRRKRRKKSQKVTSKKKKKSRLDHGKTNNELMKISEQEGVPLRMSGRLLW